MTLPTALEKEHATLKLFLLIVFVILPACGIFHCFQVARFARGAVYIKANVIGHEEETREVELSRNGLSRSRLFRYPIVRFIDKDGKTHTVTLKDERPEADQSDPKKIGILYPRNRPKQARIAHWRARYVLPVLWFFPALFVLLALLGFTIEHHARTFFSVWTDPNSGSATARAILLALL